MFTPQKDAPWTPIPPSAQKAEPLISGRLSSAAKGKSVAFADGPAPPPPPPPPAPPLGFLDGNRGGTGFDCGNMEDWRRFKEAGLLDPAALERRDHEALLNNVSRLEKELHDYQYNMGLILIEKKELASNCEELSHEIAEVREILKREQSAHYMAMSEVEKRQENLKRALDMEKNCVVDLERALHEMRDETERAKATTKRDNTDARMAQLQGERVEVEGKLHSANIRVTEADQKIKELEMKLQELQAREATLVVQHQTLDTERRAYESKHKTQKEEFKSWEKKLQEREQRLNEQRRTIEGRENNLRESEMKFKQKESDIDQLQKKIDVDNCTWKQRDDDVRKRLNELASAEKEAEAVRVDLEKREKQLHALEERLSDKERTDIQKLVDEQRAILETESEELELEMQQKRNSLDEELKSKLHAIEKREVEVDHREAKLAAMEQALKDKSERVKEKGKKIEERSKALKQEEAFVKKRENELNGDRKQLSADRENVQILNGEIEKLRDELSKKELLIEEESAKLKSNEEMRAEHMRLQSSLNNEMKKWRHQNVLLVNEKEDLNQERQKIEKDWEAVDEKRAAVEMELKKLDEEKERFHRFRHLEEEKLKEEKIEIDGQIKQESESITLEKESFAAKVKHEKLTLEENARNEHQQIVQESEQRRREFENHVQKLQEEKEKELHEKKMAFEERRTREMRNINQLKELAEKQKEEMESGWLKVKKVREELAVEKHKLEEDERGIHKDISSLDSLSNSLKDQRKQLHNERTRFLSFIEQLKVCQTCRDFTGDFISDLQLPVADEALPLPQAVDRVAGKSSPDAGDFNLSEASGQKSLLRICASKIFRFSSFKKLQDDADQCMEESPTSALQPSAEDKYSVLSSPLPHDEDNSKLQLQGSAHDRQAQYTDDPSYVDEPSNIDSKEQGIPEESEQSSLQSGRRRPRIKASAAIRRCSAKTAVGDVKNTERATSALREADEEGEPSYSNLESAEGDKTMGTTTARKRTRTKSSRKKESEHDEDSSDGPADSVPGGGRKKRKDTITPALPTPGRYNLRRHKAAGTPTASEPSNPKGASDKVVVNRGKRSKKAVPNPEQDSALDLDVISESIRSEHQGAVSTTKSIEFSSEKAVRFKMPVGGGVDNIEVAKPMESNMLSEEAYSVDNTFVSEEVRDSPEIAEEDDNESMFFENEEGDGDDGDEDDDDDDGDDGVDISIGRKFWKFFTT